MKFIWTAIACLLVSTCCHANEIAWNIHSRATPYLHKATFRAEHRRPVRRYHRAQPHRSAPVSYHCVGRVRGLGTQWIGKEGALNAARKDWMEHVRYDYGEVYIDMDNAREEELRCSRVSIGEVAGQVMYRCEIWATPCKAEMARGN